MRKLYTLVVGILTALATPKTNGQLNIQDQFSETSTTTVSTVITDNITETCQANFEVSNIASSLLTKKFTAIPWHSEQKRPVYICWYFGDGKDTCIEYPSNFTGSYVVKHKYLQPGTYQVCIKILYDGGCEAGKCKSIQIIQPDKCGAGFERIPLTNADNPLVVGFKAIPSHNNNKVPKVICWSFGDGKDTCIEYAQNFSGPYAVRHRYNVPGTYTVCIKILYYGGCESKNCKQIIVTRPDECRADFEKLLANTSNPLLVYFKALPWHNNNKKPKQICWRFGDGKDTCITYNENYTSAYAVNHKYNAPGEYEVCVKIIYFGGCEAYKCKLIVVTKPDECRADFERLPLTASNNPFTVVYKALPWHNNNKKPKQVCWKFGDGRDTCIQYGEDYTGDYLVHHIYREPGQYEVCVKILYYGGCEAYKCKLIIVTRPDECRADFERLPLTASNNPLTVVYKALPWHNNNKKPKQICWKFGDGRDTCIQYGEDYTGDYLVHHSYREPGQYEVCVKILYYGGCEAYKCKTINIGEFCRADFEKLLVNTTTNPLVAYFKASPFHSLDKKPKLICWYFGDGRDTCIEYPENFTGLYAVKHEYREPGQYEVCIKIFYYGGCEAKKCKVIQIGEPVRCKADFERILISSVNSPLHVAFRALPWHIENKKPKEICWKFGDGRDTCIQYGEDYTGSYVVHHLYDYSGTYEVCVKILYHGGCEAKKCELIKVEAPGECHVKLFEIIPSVTSLVRGFYASLWSSENKRPLRICWYFGDGTDSCVEINSTISTSQLFIRHTYPAPGVYKACAKVLFDGGCIAFDCSEVIIRPITNACGGYMTDSLISPRTFKFKAFAIHNPDDPVAGYRWTFGDGSASNGSEVTHQYNAPGTYEVCLTIKTQRGCETRICKPLNVPGNTQIALQITPNPVLNNIMHVLFYPTHTEQVTLRIVNANGVVVKAWIRNVTQGANNWDFDVSTLIAGAYTLYIQSPNQLASQLFIKAN